MANPFGQAEFVGSFVGDLPDLGLPEVAFAGRSNVGKSSMLNRLVGQRQMARVSSTPGRTQTINLFRVGKGLIFADLPGYGFAKVPGAVREQWHGMIERYFSLREPLKLVVVLVDARHPPQPLDVMLIRAMQELDLPTAIVATKVDKLTRNQRRQQLASLAGGFEIAPEALIPFSSLAGEGVDLLWARIAEFIEVSR